MTVKELIDSLIEQGHKVEYRKRVDGSYLITSIDNTKYTGAKGNAAARVHLGVKLSKARKAQLKVATKKHKAKHKKLSPGLEKQLKRTQRKWRTGVESGRVTKKKARWILEHEGAAALKRKLRRLEHHAEGYVYPEEVEGYLFKLARVIAFSETYEIQAILQKAYRYIEKRKNKFKYTWLETIRNRYPSDELYMLSESVEAANEFFNYIKSVITA